MKKVCMLALAIITLVALSSCENLGELKRKNSGAAAGAEFKIINISSQPYTFVIGASTITQEPLTPAGGTGTGNIAINQTPDRTMVDDYIPVIVADEKGNKKRYSIEIQEKVVTVPGKFVIISPVKWNGESFTSDSGSIKSVERIKVN